MVIGETFLWLHFPKFAGTTTTYVLNRHFGKDPAVHLVPPDMNDSQHETLREREARLGTSLEDSRHGYVFRL